MLKQNMAIMKRKKVPAGDEEIDERTGKRKKVKLDSKAVLLERVDTLNQRISNLILYLVKILTQLYNPKLAKSNKPQVALDDEIYKQIIERLSTEYDYFANEIKNEGTVEDPKQPLTRVAYNVAEYTNKLINNDKLFGDIRDELNKFYRNYNFVFYNPTKKTYSGDSSVNNLKYNWGDLYKKLGATYGWPFAGISGAKLT